MGEFADMEIERGFDDYIDYHTGSGKYSEEDMNFFDEWEGEEIPVIRSDKFEAYHYDMKIRETSKSTLLHIEEDDKVHWFSKQYCKITKDQVLVPTWLARKIFV